MGLYGLHLLDITDKHHVLIPTAQDIVITAQIGDRTFNNVRITVHQGNK